MMNPVLQRLAFLDTIAQSEGTSTCPITRDKGYDVVVTGIDHKFEIFTDYSDHPFAKGRPSKVINSKGLTSNAAGRYQFMLRDWAHYKMLLKLPDFGPSSQDRWALQLIRERGALPLIDAGQFELAIERCRNIWASLPGAGYGQHENNLEDLTVVFTQHGGMLSRAPNSPPALKGTS